MRQCSFEGCERKHDSNGLCAAHNRQQRAGNQLTPIRFKSRHGATAEEMLDAWLDKSGECWLWNGSTWNGYGKTNFRGRRMQAHRFAYETYVGPAPDGSVVHHKCANKLCCNPDHLQLTTHADNTAEMLSRRSMLRTIEELTHKLEAAYVRIAELEGT